MTGTSIIMPDAVLAQSGVLASQWAPEGVAPLLTGEYVFDGGQTASLINHANPTVLPTLVGTPAFNAHSMTTAGSTQGVSTGLFASQPDQTFMAVLKAPTAAGGIFAQKADSSSQWLGILYGVTAGKFGFYNGLASVGPDVPEVSPVAGGNFFAVIGWGSGGGVGKIRTAAAGALNATVTGTLAGDRSNYTTYPIKVGGDVQASPTFEIAYAARCTTILTDAQQLAWYAAVKAALTTAGLTVA